MKYKNRQTETIMRRIVDLFYTLDDVKDSTLDSDLVSILKDAEMYANIYGKRNLTSESVNLIKHWIYSLSVKNCKDDAQRKERNDTASKLLE